MKRLFKIEDFDARFVGRNQVSLYPFKRERFPEITIRVPSIEINVRTGKPGFDQGRLFVGTSSYYHTTAKRSIRFGRAIIAAAIYLQEARMEARKVPK